MPNKNNKNNKVLVQSAENAIDQLKYEIAQAFGVQLGPETTSRINGSVGGEITRQLVHMGQEFITNPEQNAQINLERFMTDHEHGGPAGISASDLLSRMNGGQRPTGR